METDKKLFPKDGNIHKEEILLFSNEQGLKRNQNQMKIIQNPSGQNKINISNYSMGNNLISRLMNTNMSEYIAEQPVHVSLGVKNLYLT